MAPTLEGKIKQRLKKALQKKCGEKLYLYMPVPAGYGSATLDFLGSYRGFAFAIETKAPGKDLTPRQKVVAMNIRKSDTPVFTVRTDTDIALVLGWVDTVDVLHERFYDSN